MKKIVLLVMLAFFTGCNGCKSPREDGFWYTGSSEDPNLTWGDATKGIDYDWEIVDPRPSDITFYVPSHQSVVLNITLDANSIEEAAQQLRWSIMADRNMDVDFEVTIDNITKQTSFEELFKWMGFDDDALSGKD